MDIGPDVHQRKRLLQLAAVAVLHAQPMRADSIDFLHALSRQLAVHDSVLDAIDAVYAGRHFKARLLSMRRGMRVMFKEAYLSEGVVGVLRFVGALALKVAVNKDKFWHYKRLGLLPEGTLGREYWKHMTEVGFGFPGEPAGIADSVAYHDVLHVLAGNETTPHGEIQQGAFQAGNRREDGFFFLQMVMLQFHQGVQVTPATRRLHRQLPSRPGAVGDPPRREVQRRHDAPVELLAADGAADRRGALDASGCCPSCRPRRRCGPWHEGRERRAAGGVSRRRCVQRGQPGLNCPIHAAQCSMHALIFGRRWRVLAVTA